MEQSKKVVETARTIKIISLAEYQGGSIVSRTLIDKKAGTVTFFAFDEGQGLSEHVSPYDALVNVLDGEAEVAISEKIYHVKEGEMIVLPANKPHALKATKKFKMILIMIKA
jgi:quercetin dioxygenase-like cupin family protein